MAKKKDGAEGADAEEKGGGLGGKLKLAAMILPTVLLIAGAVYVFVLSPSGSSATPTTAAVKASATEDPSAEDPGSAPASTFVAGKVVTVDPVTINLASGHYLKVGLGLQATADAGEEVTASKAADALISQFSGKTVDEIATKEGRDAAKKALLKVIMKAYEKKVYEIYWTTFVMN